MITAGQTPLALRQESAAAFTGVAPLDGTAPTPIAYVPRANGITQIIQYVDPNDNSLKALAQGGLFDFGNQTVRVLEIRAHASNGNISAIVGDRGDVLHDTAMGTPATSVLTFTTPLIVLPSQILKVSTVSANAAGYLDVYIVKGDWF